MADLNDASGAVQRRDGQRELLESADIDERDRDAIQKYTRHRRVHGAANGGDYAPTTETNDLCYLRLASERASVALVDMGIDDCNNLLETLTAPTDAGGYGISSGIDSYTQVLRMFFGWLDAHDEFGSFGWYEQISTSTADRPEPSERRFPSQADIDAMIDAARRNNNPRDAALVSFLADAAVRRTLCAQLRVGDVDLEGARPTFAPNPDGESQKGVEVKPYPLYDCVADLRVWVTTYHPDPGNDAAPLWTTDDYTPESPGECALSVARLRGVLRDLADDSGLGADIEVSPHAFRHAAIGRWKERGYSLAQVQRRTAWKDSAAAEMWAKYGSPDDAKVDAAIDELEGRDPPAVSDDSAAPVSRYDCGNCGSEGWTTGHCGQCGAPVSPSAKTAADTARMVVDRLEELAVRLDDPGDREMTLDVKRRVQASPESVDVERVHDLLSELESSAD